MPALVNVIHRSSDKMKLQSQPDAQVQDKPLMRQVGIEPIRITKPILQRKHRL